MRGVLFRALVWFKDFMGLHGMQRHPVRCFLVLDHCQSSVHGVVCGRREDSLHIPWEDQDVKQSHEIESNRS